MTSREHQADGAEAPFRNLEENTVFRVQLIILWLKFSIFRTCGGYQQRMLRIFSPKLCNFTLNTRKKIQNFSVTPGKVIFNSLSFYHEIFFWLRSAEHDLVWGTFSLFFLVL